jgi:hypothetical protein
MIPQEEGCPVSDNLLGMMYRAGPEGLPELVKSVPAAVRALLAIYCFRREHLRSLGLAIASTCDEGDLTEHGGKMGSAIIAEMRRPTSTPSPKITLCREPLRHFVMQDLV